MLERIGKYEIRRELGRGGMGQVYLAFDPTVGRNVAIKVLPAGGDASLLARFRTEAAAAGGLNHLNIVTIYEFGEDQGTFYLAMEYLQGRDLQHVMPEANTLTLIEKMRIMSQVAEGLKYAHHRGVVHRDVKPANIMLQDDGIVKIMDFGIARLTTSDNSQQRQTLPGYLIGTLAYMAPEQLSGKEADAVCDIWAFGTIYYELLAGRHPFDVPDCRIQALVPECPATLDAVIARLLSKTREGRYQSLEDVLFDTAPILLDLETKQAGILVAQARELIAQEKLDEAQLLVKQILALDRSREDGRALYREIRAAMDRRTHRARVKSLLEQAEWAASARDFASAIQAIESALKIDGDVDDYKAALSSRLAELRTAKERLDLAQLWLTRARKDFDLDNLTGAFQAASDALGAEPDNAEAQQLLSQVQQRISERDAERRLRDGMARVKGLLALQSFDEAVELLESLLQQAPGSLPLQELLERTRRQRDDYNRQRLIRSEIEAARDSIKSRDFDGAIARLKPLADEPSCKTEVAGLISYAEDERAEADRVRKIESIEREARTRLQARDFEGALAVVEAELRSYPENVSLNRLRQTILFERAQENRSRAIEQALAESAAYDRAGRLEEAIGPLESALRAYPGDAKLEAALDQARRKHREQQERARLAAIESGLKRAEQLCENGDFSSAAQLLQQMLAAYPGEAAIITLFGRVQAEANRHEALEAFYAEVRPYLKSQQLVRATELIQRAKLQFGADPTLDALEAETSRKLARLGHLERARRAIEHRDWEVAEGALRAVLAQDGSDSEAQALLAKVRDGELAQRQRLRRENGRQEAGSLLKGLQFDGAVQILQALHDEFPGDVGIQDDLRAALDAKERHLRREAFTRGRSQADSLLRQGQFDAAISALEKLIGQFPDDAGLRDDLSAAKEGKREKDRRDRSAGERRRAAELVKARKFDEAIAVLQALLTDFPDDLQLQEDLKSALEAKALQAHREALDRTVRQLEKLYGKGDAQGVKEKASLLASDLQDARIRELVEWAEKETARQAQDPARLSADELRRGRKRRIVWVAAAAAVLALAILIPYAVRHRPVQTVQPVQAHLLPTSEQLSFSLRAGEPRSSQSVSIRSDGAPVKWTASVSAEWLSVEPREGITPADVKVLVDPSGLNPSSYSGNVSFSSEDGDASLRTAVKLVVAPPEVVAQLVPVPKPQPLPQPKIQPAPAPKQPPVPAPNPPPVTEPNPQPVPVSNPQPVSEPTPPKPQQPEVKDCKAAGYNLPRSGKLRWQSNRGLEPNGILVIGGSDERLAGGNLTGNPFPRCEITVTPTTKGIEIDEQPQRKDGYIRVKLHNSGGTPISVIGLKWSATK